MGANRTLLLWDGQRMPSGTFIGVVDADIVPEMLTKRADVVTGGSSAVYGSDAIAGVVNFITDNAFNGVKYQAQYGISNYHDDKSYKLGIAGGTNVLDGRGHVEFSLLDTHDDGVLRRSDRPWGAGVYGTSPNGPSTFCQANPGDQSCGRGGANNPYFLYLNARHNDGSYGGLILGGCTDPQCNNTVASPLDSMTFNSNNVLSAYNAGQPVPGRGNYQIGGDGGTIDSALKSSADNDQVFARFDVDVNDSVRFHIQGVGDFKKNITPDQENQFSNLTISSTNAYLPQAYQDQLAAAGVPYIQFGRYFLQGPFHQITSRDEQYLFIAGLEGKAGAFNWEVNANYGRSILSDTLIANINQQHLAAALDAVKDPATGNIVCNVTLTNPAADPGCVPLNLFGPTSASAAAINYINATSHLRVDNHIEATNFAIRGPLFTEWAGVVNGALTGEWRHIRLGFVTDSPSTLPYVDPATGNQATLTADCTGLTMNCAPGNTLLYQDTWSSMPEVAESVEEIAAEVDVPLVTDAPFLKHMDLDLAGRHTDYDTSGQYDTWKAGLVAQFNPTLTLRGTVSRDIRAPNLYELFSPTTHGLGAGNDFLTGATVVTDNRNGGNPNLKAEVGFTQTVGFVVTPGFLPGFSAAVDYFNIDLERAVFSLAGGDQITQQACYNSGGTSPACQLIVRSDGSCCNPGASLDYSKGGYLLNENINLAKLVTAGWDFEFNYRTRVIDRPLALRLLSTYEPHVRTIVPPVYQQPDDDLGGAAEQGAEPSASLRMLFTADMDVTDRFSVSLAEQWRSRLKPSGDTSQFYDKSAYIAAIGYTDLDLTYKLNPGGTNMDVNLHISNLLNSSPPPAGIGGNTAWVGSDDIIGRYYTLALRGRF
jgi:outer membrane receptor protein involved in Fe transport